MKVPSAGRILVKLKANTPQTVRRASISIVQPGAVPVVIASPDAIRAAQLNHREGFLLSLIDGVIDVEALLDCCGMHEDEAFAVLDGLVRSHIVSLSGVRVARGRSAARRSLHPPRGSSK